MVVYGILAGVGAVMLLVSIIFDDLFDGLLDAGPDWLTGVGIGAFLATMGLGGLLGNSLGLSPVVTPIMAVVLAFAVSAGVNTLSVRLLANSERAVTREDLVGHQGTSILGAKAGDAGEILLTVNGQPMKVNGRCDTDLKPGDPVEVTSAFSITSVAVRKI